MNNGSFKARLELLEKAAAVVKPAQELRPTVLAEFPLLAAWLNRAGLMPCPHTLMEPFTCPGRRYSYNELPGVGETLFNLTVEVVALRQALVGNPKPVERELLAGWLDIALQHPIDHCILEAGLITRLRYLHPHPAGLIPWGGALVNPLLIYRSFAGMLTPECDEPGGVLARQRWDDFCTEHFGGVGSHHPPKAGKLALHYIAEKYE